MAKLENDSLITIINELAASEFPSTSSFYDEIKTRLDEEQLKLVKSLDFLKEEGKIALRGFIPIESGFYAMLTFGSLLFLVAGLYLQEISKLKFGAIELEKSTVDLKEISQMKFESIEISKSSIDQISTFGITQAIG